MQIRSAEQIASETEKSSRMKQRIKDIETGRELSDMEDRMRRTNKHLIGVLKGRNVRVNSLGNSS